MYLKPVNTRRHSPKDKGVLLDSNEKKKKFNRAAEVQIEARM
jgi:hypothetical protein